MEAIIGAADAQQKKELLRSETTFNLWQSILRGAGVITGGRCLSGRRRLCRHADGRAR
jgi:hypothetical protein